MNLEGWNWEDATFKKDIGIHLNWPSRLTNDFNNLTYRYEKVKNKNYESSMQELRSFFEECTSYNAEETKNKNLKLEAMQGLFSGEKILFIHADGTKEIIESIKFAQEFNVQKIAMIAGTGSIDAASFLVENNIPVIMQNVHSLPNTQDMEYDLPYRLASILNNAGVQVSLSYTSLSSCRNLPFFAGTAVTYGVDYETAIQMITLNTAKALGIDDEVGSIVEGKRATLFVSKGDALNMMTNAVTYAFIDGKMIDLEGEQQLLYERYAKKYTEEGIEIESE
jgi:imidazolonepropionase-like amidohydrolase